jgi:hypothetical protein
MRRAQGIRCSLSHQINSSLTSEPWGLAVFRNQSNFLVAE